MPTKYPSIESLYKRDPVTKRLNVGQVRDETWLAIKEWHLTEKIDGTNTRLIYRPGDPVDIRGRTDRTQWTPKVLDRLRELAPTPESVWDRFAADEGAVVTLYGETYGAGIQKGGGVYRPDPFFRLFDVRLTNEVTGRDIWLSGHDVRQVALSLEIGIVPNLARITEFPRTREDLLALTGDFSITAHADSGQKPLPEGVVARPPVTLYDNRGRRLMWKLTFRDL